VFVFLFVALQLVSISGGQVERRLPEYLTT